MGSDGLTRLNLRGQDQDAKNMAQTVDHAMRIGDWCALALTNTRKLYQDHS